MHHAQSGGSRKLDGKITVTDCIQRVLANLRLSTAINHAQGSGNPFAVQRVAGAGQRCRPQGQTVGAMPNLAHAFAVAAEHFDVGQQMVAKTDRLRYLQMGETRQDDVDVALCNMEECRLQFAQQRTDQIYFSAQPQADIGGDLVVA